MSTGTGKTTSLIFPKVSLVMCPSRWAVLSWSQEVITLKHLIAQSLQGLNFGPKVHNDQRTCSSESLLDQALICMTRIKINSTGTVCKCCCRHFFFKICSVATVQRAFCLGDASVVYQKMNAISLFCTLFDSKNDRLWADSNHGDVWCHCKGVSVLCRLISHSMTFHVFHVEIFPS